MRMSILTPRWQACSGISGRLGVEYAGLEQNGLATKKIYAPEAVFGMSDKCKPRLKAWQNGGDHLWLSVGIQVITGNSPRIRFTGGKCRGYPEKGTKNIIM